MTPSEITALRKAGRLTEALEAAEAAYAERVNGYSIGSLFWCLNDLYKTQHGEELEKTVARMHTIYNELSMVDEYMQRSLASAERRVLPHSSRIKETIEQAKAGDNVSSSQRELFALFEHGEIDQRLQNDLGWLTYYVLKSTPVSDAYSRKILLNQYFKLNLERPSILHSLILGEGVKVEQNTPLQFRIRDFIKLWGLENLREDDWAQFTTDSGNTLPSTVEKLIGVYAKELKTDKVESPKDFAELVDKALLKYPKSQNMPYFKATILLSQGRNEEALKYYRKLILKFPTKYYLWNQISELVDDLDTKIGLLSKALNCGDEEGFLGGVRLRMAALLLKKGLLSNAKFELEKYSSTYQSKGWNLKPEFWNLYNHMTSVETASDNRRLYSDYSLYANQFIYNDLPEQLIIKVAERQIDDRNHPGRKFTQWTLRSQTGTLTLKKPVKFGLVSRTPNGTLFSVKTHEGRIVWIRPMRTTPQVSWLKEVSGTIQQRTDRKGNRYTIIQGVYVGEKILKGTADGQTIKALAIQQEDGRWSAISLIH